MVKQLRDEGQSAFRHSGNGLEGQSLWLHVRTRKWRKILCMLDLIDLQVQPHELVKKGGTLEK
jgi:hypothetical protein